MGVTGGHDSDFIPNGLGARVRFLRGDRSQKAFGEMVGVSQSTVGRWESGKRAPDADELSRVCARFNLDPQWLLNGTGVPPDGFDAVERAVYDIQSGDFSSVSL